MKLYHNIVGVLISCNTATYAIGLAGTVTEILNRLLYIFQAILRLMLYTGTSARTRGLPALFRGVDREDK